MSNPSRIARITEQEDRLLEQVEASQHLLTAIIRHIEQRSASLGSASARAVALEAHRQFAEADRRLLKFRPRLVYERSKDAQK